MTYAIWALIIGTLLILMALSGTFLKRLPISTAMLYLAVGYGLSPAGLNLMSPDPRIHSAFSFPCSPSGSSSDSRFLTRDGACRYA